MYSAHHDGGQSSRPHTAVEEWREVTAGAQFAFLSVFIYLCAPSQVSSGAHMHALLKARVKLRCHFLGALVCELGLSLGHRACELG